MKTYIKNHSLFGETLFAKNGDIVIGIPLDHGIRISYLSYNGSDNLFFEQPKDMTDLTTPNGWRVYGGHRLWTAPECKEIYYPDNEPISYELLDRTIIIRQNADPWKKVEKTMEISFVSDDSITINHIVKNIDTEAQNFSIWPVTSIAPGGTEFIPLKYAESGSVPVNKITTWFYTSLGDERATYKRESITLRHQATGTRYKIGVAHPSGPISYTNKGVVFEKIYDIFSDKEYPDGNVSYETYMCDYMVELESLSPLYTVKTGESVSFKETWKLKKEY